MKKVTAGGLPAVVCSFVHCPIPARTWRRVTGTMHGAKLQSDSCCLNNPLLYSHPSGNTWLSIHSIFGC
ncbi:MAG: hypothetical protein F8N35_07700 [Paludibacter sp.]|nr:hypothetical protein [Paludibacter sp.]